MKGNNQYPLNITKLFGHIYNEQETSKLFKPNK